MTLSRDDVDHVATLARLGLSDAEKDRLLGELEEILGHIARLQQVDTSTLAETAQVGDLVNVMRDDDPGAPIGAAAALRNAPATDGATSWSGPSRATSLTPRTITELAGGAPRRYARHPGAARRRARARRAMRART